MGGLQADGVMESEYVANFCNDNGIDIDKLRKCTVRAEHKEYEFIAESGQRVLKMEICDQYVKFLVDKNISAVKKD